MKRRRWDAILNRVAPNERSVGVEVGVWTGKNASQLLMARPQMTLYLVDAWKAAEPDSSFANSGAEMAAFGQEKFDQAKDKVITLAKQYGRRVKIVAMDTEAAAIEIEKRRVKLNFIFIDGDHSYEGVTRDLEIWSRFLESNGLYWIGGHDYGNTKGEVKQAVNKFFGTDRVQVDTDHTWFVFAQ